MVRYKQVGTIRHNTMTGTIYSGRESKTLEFKSTVKKFAGITKTAIAFANGVGGKIIIGIEDKSQTIIGIDHKVRDLIYNDFPNSLYDSTSPRLIPQIYEQRIADKIVLIIEIPPSFKKPCFLLSEGSIKGVYIRIGSSTRRTDEEHIAELMRANRSLSYDEETIETDIKILSEEFLSTHYNKHSKEILLADKIIAYAPANHETFYPTIAGLLLFAASPDRHIPEAHILCTRFADTEGRDIIQTEEIQGPISKQIDVSFNLVSSWLKRNYKLTGTRLLPKKLIPDAALREAITNAVVHRKYSIPGAIKIGCYDDRLEIFSPGNFPGHVNISNLGNGITHFRNPIIGRMAHKTGLIEKLGSGIKLIFSSCKKDGIAKPIFSEDGDYVKIIFEFKPRQDGTKSNEEMLLELFKTSEILTTSEIIDYLDKSKNTVFRILRKLIKKNVVAKVGKGPATRYTLK